MRVLFVTPQFPEDPSRSISGAFRRMRMWLDAIRSANATVELLVFTPSRADASPESAARVARALTESWDLTAEVTLCPVEAPVDRHGALAEYVRPMLSMVGHSVFGIYAGVRQQVALRAALSRSPDVVFFHSLFSAAAKWTRPPGARVFLDMPDIEHRRFLRDLSQPPYSPLKPLRRLWAPALWWGERRAIQRSDQAFVCSDTDRDYLARSMGVRNVTVIPNATTHVDDHAQSGEPNVLFLGTYAYPPNRIAAELLVREIWPILHGLRPESKLLIAGPNCEQIAGHDAPPEGVEFLGFVEDLDKLYARTRVFCCPIQSGGGTRVKILEAANQGVPVVSTPLGAEGIDLVPEREIILRRTPAELASACAELLADPARAREVGERGRERVRALYGRERIVARMRAALTGEAS